MEQYLRIFKALSDEKRLRIINLLLSSGRELCVCEIVDALDEPQYNVSKHVKELKYAGLIEEKRMGRWVSYALTPAGDNFKQQVLQAITSIPKEFMAEDLERLKARLFLRKNGKCIIGLKNQMWENIVKKIKKEGESI
jgi:ArsR family transcriptional regulator